MFNWLTPDVDPLPDDPRVPTDAVANLQGLASLRPERTRNLHRISADPVAKRDI
jgi:hypothetical protein